MNKDKRQLHWEVGWKVMMCKGLSPVTRTKFTLPVCSKAWYLNESPFLSRLWWLRILALPMWILVGGSLLSESL